MLALGYMLQNSPEWRGSQLILKSIVKTVEEEKSARLGLEHFLADGRLDVGLEILVESDWKNKLHETIRNSSEGADLVFIGMRPPDSDESTADYAKYYKGLIDMTNDFPPTAIVTAAQKIDFANIFD